MKHAPTPAAAASILTQAIAAAAGPALVLDSELRVIVATAEAQALLGASSTSGAPAAQLLDESRSELVRSLAAGAPFRASARASGTSAPREITIRATRLGPAAAPLGYLCLVEASAVAGAAPEFHGMLTRTAAMQQVFRVIERVAVEDVTVLLRGETGTGKELAAQAIHRLSKRAHAAFRAINCAALPANLLESELFGHVRGAFTGAVRDAPGHFQLADRGTLFLDEVGELPLELQAKLLRVIETRSVLPVGAQKPVRVDVRIISATHKALRKEVEAGRFRADLMYRLRVIPIFLPALRERRDDIGLLSDQLIASMNATSRRRIERVAPAAREVLERYDWPGNVRELQNVLAYAYVVGDGPLLQPRDLPPELLEAVHGAGPSSVEPADLRETADRDARELRAALARTGGNKSQAAKLLGISRVTLWRRLRAVPH